MVVLSELHRWRLRGRASDHVAGRRCIKHEWPRGFPFNVGGLLATNSSYAGEEGGVPVNSCDGRSVGYLVLGGQTKLFWFLSAKIKEQK